MDNLRLLYENDEDFALMAREHALDFIGTSSLTFAKEWLESAIGSEMRQSTPEERAEYERMLAKYSTNVGVNIFDLERQAEIPDSREKLEADIRCSLGFTTKDVFGWLDRQAAITERELCALLEENGVHVSHDGLRHITTVEVQRIYDQNVEIAELQAQVDGLKAECAECVYKQEFDDIDRLKSALDSICSKLGIVSPGKPDILAKLAIASIDALIAERYKLAAERERWRDTCGALMDKAHEIERIMAEMEAR